MGKGTQKEIEKRQFSRLEKTLPVEFGLPEVPASSRSFEALTRDIGEGGAFIETDLAQDENFALNKDAILNIEIELLGQGQSVKPKGRIVWLSKKSRSPQKKRSGFGVRFIQISAQEKRAISLFVSKEMLAQTEPIEKAIPVILREQKLTDRQRRNLEILDVIRKHRLISRAEISKHTNINIVTVSNYIDTYLKKGLVFERGLDISTGGRRPELVEINPHYGYVIGVDLGLLNASSAVLEVVATDFTTRLLARAREKRKDSFEECLDDLKDLIGEILVNEKLERKKVRGIGIGICGIMDKFGGTVRNPCTGATFANYVSIKKELEEEFNLPVVIESSAACALFAEKWVGASLEVKAADNIIYIFSDNQCSIMLRGELYSGSSRSAGQLNFALPRADASNSSFCWMNPSLECLLRPAVSDLEKAAGSEQDLSLAGTKLGAKIAYLVNIFNPQLVIIDRNSCPSGDSFLDAIRRTVNNFALRETSQQVRIIPASLGEDATALGAASLVIEAAFANI